ncbi:Rrf2 family transcriptional regulator [Corynebacterium callunae]|uniref:RrF2 family transcriptional regulator n=1 Tax=Corynebacterium callunae TaxID=1721 RepID=UPI00398194AE
MHLTTFADLGLRSMMILGDLPAGQRLTISELAEATNSSNNHLARVIAKLVEMELVTSIRGRSGGVLLPDSARGASVGQILRELEGPGEVVDCEGTKPCPLAAYDCKLRHRLAAAKEAFFAELDGDTIGDLIRVNRVAGQPNPRPNSGPNSGPNPGPNSEGAHGASTSLGLPTLRNT